MKQEFEDEVDMRASAEFDDKAVKGDELVLIKSFLGDILKELVIQAENDKE